MVENTIMLSGKALTFGENIPIQNGKIHIYELDATTGFRTQQVADLSVSATGKWGPWTAQADTHYEFEVSGTDTESPIHYYREPFVRSNPYVYLRTIPPPGSLAGTLLSLLPRDDAQTVLVVFSSSKAVITGRDQMMINEVNLATNELASPEQSAIAFFAYDHNNDQQTSGMTNPLFAAFPFLNGVDVFMPTQTLSTISVQYNERSVLVRNWQSATDGPTVVVFD